MTTVVEGRRQMVSFRLEPKVLAKLRDIADHNGQSISGLLRAAVLRLVREYAQSLTMQQELSALLRLRPGWDGYQARPPTDRAVYRAIELLHALGRGPEPQVFPLPDGGTQLEWHAGTSAEIEIDAEGNAHLLIAKGDQVLLNEELTDANLEANLNRVREVLKDLAERLKRCPCPVHRRGRE